jgi:hypothetical protein
VERTGDGNTLTISSRGDAERAAASVTWLARPHFEAVHIDLDGFDMASAAALGTRIRRLFNDCGCAWGEITLAAAVVVLLLGPPLVGWPSGLGWASGIAICAVAAVAGKLFGLAWSRRRVHHLLRQLAATSTPG